MPSEGRGGRPSLAGQPEPRNRKTLGGRVEPQGGDQPPEAGRVQQGVDAVHLDRVLAVGMAVAVGEGGQLHAEGIEALGNVTGGVPGREALEALLHQRGQGSAVLVGLEALLALGRAHHHQRAAKALLQLVHHLQPAGAAVRLVGHAIGVLHGDAVQLLHLQGGVSVEDPPHAQRHVERVAAKDDAHQVLDEAEGHGVPVHEPRALEEPFAGLRLGIDQPLQELQVAHHHPGPRDPGRPGGTAGAAARLVGQPAALHRDGALQAGQGPAGRIERGRAVSQDEEGELEGALEQHARGSARLLLRVALRAIAGEVARPNQLAALPTHVHEVSSSLW